MNREEYNACIGKGMTGKKLSREERNLEFCVVAKTCSGKAKTREEAIKICSQPKEPKEPKVSRRRKVDTCNIDPRKLATCVVKNIEPGRIPSELEIANALSGCIK